MIGRPEQHRFGAYQSYEEAKELLLKGSRLFYRMMLHDGYWLVDDMTEPDTPKPESVKIDNLLVQSLPVWVGMHIKSNLFFRALYSWDDLWDTVTAGWTIFGDPGSLSVDQWYEWLNEKIPLLHGGYIAGCGRSIFLLRLEDTGDGIARLWLLYDHAYRVMDWLGFVESTMPMWWLMAFMRGQWERVEIWRSWFKTYIAYSITQSLRPFQDMVEAIAKDKLPKESNAVAMFCPPPSYDIKDRYRGGKYPEFDSRLLFPSYKRSIITSSTYMLDPLTKEKKQAIQDLWRSTDPHVRVKGLDDAEDRVEEARQRLERALKHPMYRQIQMAKFQASKKSREKLKKIHDLINECSQGKSSVQELLEWALMSDQSESAKNRLKDFDEAIRYGKRYTQKHVLDKVYKQVKAWFDRRRLTMPEAESDWRDKIIQKRILEITR